MSMALDDIRAALLVGHIYQGFCPDTTEAERLEVRDLQCPACRVLVAIDEVRSGRQPAEAADQVAYNIVAAYALRPSATYLESEITAAIRDAEARANHRALDLQYALDAEYQAHQPIKIEGGELPAMYTHGLWFRRGVGWQAGYRGAYLGKEVITVADGAKVPINLFTHYMPPPPDPPAA